MDEDRQRAARAASPAYGGQSAAAAAAAAALAYCNTSLLERFGVALFIAGKCNYYYY